MKRLLKIILIIIILIVVTAFWYWVDDQDYFQSNYSKLTTEQEKIFKWQDGDDEEKLMERYRQHFTDTIYLFPRQRVCKIKMFKNLPIIGAFTGKILKHDKIDNFIKFCNDSVNFDWGETTWGINESEYYFKLYNLDNEVIGKIYFMLLEQPMKDSRPFCPSMKFGGLSEIGFNKIVKLINNKNNWD